MALQCQWDAGQAKDSSRDYANYVTVCINRCPRRLFEHTPLSVSLPISLFLPLPKLCCAASSMTHKVACCGAINYQQASSLVLKRLTIEVSPSPWPSLPLPSACHSHSTFKKLNATKCSCLMETLDGLAAARWSLSSPPPLERCSIACPLLWAYLKQAKQQFSSSSRVFLARPRLKCAA